MAYEEYFEQELMDSKEKEEIEKIQKKIADLQAKIKKEEQKAKSKKENIANLVKLKKETIAFKIYDGISEAAEFQIPEELVDDIVRCITNNPQIMQKIEKIKNDFLRKSGKEIEQKTETTTDTPAEPEQEKPQNGFFNR